MKKLSKQLLTGLIALGLLAPVATTALNPIRTTVNARRVRRHHSSWHRGTPRAINGWFKQNAGRYRFSVYCGDGLAGTYLMHHYNHKWHFSNFEEEHAHYKYLGHGKYRVSTRSSKFTIRKHGRSHVSVWWHGFYFGNCHKYSF